MPVAEQQDSVELLDAASGICGAKIVMSVNGVDVSAEQLCPYHWRLKHGDAAYVAPIVLEP